MSPPPPHDRGPHEHPSGAPPLARRWREELAASSLAFDAATLRCDEALASGDVDEVAAAVDEQRAVLAAFERRLSAAVAQAVMVRDAEGA